MPNITQPLSSFPDSVVFKLAQGSTGVGTSMATIDASWIRGLASSAWPRPLNPFEGAVRSELAAHPLAHELSKLYGSGLSAEELRTELQCQIKRYDSLVARHVGTVGCTHDSVTCFSSSGRVEFLGNHVDHQRGTAVAGSTNLDTIAAASRDASRKITIYSDMKGSVQAFICDLDDLAPAAKEHATTQLLREMLLEFQRKGVKLGGFNCSVSGNIPTGSGLSSSASFQMLIGKVISDLFNDGVIPISVMAKVGQHAENTAWKKKSGLLDQLACAEPGGLKLIDFKNVDSLSVSQITFAPSLIGCDILVIDTGGDHSGDDASYSSIPDDMSAVARALSNNEYSYLRYLTDAQIAQLNDPVANHELRQRLGDRGAIMVQRAEHFFAEQGRVQLFKEAVARDDYRSALKLITASGNSSAELLENLTSGKDRGLKSTLQLIEKLMNQAREDDRGFAPDPNHARRLHGGGFKGTVLAIVPRCHTAALAESLQATGRVVHLVRFREEGLARVGPLAK